jgi:hypothetical protein
MTDIPTYDPATQDLWETIDTDEDGNEVRTYEVKDKPDWRIAEYETEQFNAGLPSTVSDINGGLVEVADMTDTNTSALEDVQSALVELAELITTNTTESEA